MASSCASESTSQFPRWNYKVFLSFRGEDTRRTFTGHLFKGLENSGIFTFQDDKRLEHGASISDELLKAIEQSQVALVVFSKNYATSRWCLDELVKIMECKDQCGQTVIPVFYGVDPSHVRKQRESFAEAFDRHETSYKDDDEGMEKLQRWRNALTAAANLKGYDVRDGIEAENIQQIVDQISKLCNSATLSSLSDVVGIDTHLEKLKSLLKIQMHDLIQEMGKYIVNLQKNPGERSRLWLVKDFKEVINNNTGTMAMEAIFLPYFNSGILRFSKKAMKNMKRLRILNIERSLTYDGSIEYLPNNLRWFVLYGHPCESLPSTFEPKMLVHLELWGSSLHYLWMETKHLPSLRRIDLSSSRSLMRTPDFTGMPNLEYLNMLYCSNLEEVHHSLRCCNKLIRLNLNYCKSLKRFPCVNVESLEYLSLEYCSRLEKFPEIHGRMKPEIQFCL